MLKGAVTGVKEAEGILWFEGSDLDGKTRQQYFVVMNRNPCGAIRSALRDAEWK